MTVHTTKRRGNPPTNLQAAPNTARKSWNNKRGRSCSVGTRSMVSAHGHSCSESTRRASDKISRSVMNLQGQAVALTKVEANRRVDRFVEGRYSLAGAKRKWRPWEEENGKQTEPAAQGLMLASPLTDVYDHIDFSIYDENFSKNRSPSIVSLSPLHAENLDTEDARPAKRIAVWESVRVPLDDHEAYRVAVEEGDFRTLGPCEEAAIWSAELNGDGGKIVIGQGVGDEGEALSLEIEALIFDPELWKPWQVLKVTEEFRTVDYEAECQHREGTPVSPKTIPTMGMTGAREGYWGEPPE